MPPFIKAFLNWMVELQRFLTFSPRNLGKMIQFDYYFSNGLFQPPTSKTFELIRVSSVEEKRFFGTQCSFGEFSSAVICQVCFGQKNSPRGVGILGAK